MKKRGVAIITALFAGLFFTSSIFLFESTTQFASVPLFQFNKSVLSCSLTCTDSSDGGNNIFLRGTDRYKNSSCRRESVTDYCYNNTAVYEYINCFNSEILSCPNSYQCAFGRCIVTHNLEVRKSGNGQGIVTSNISGINCGNDCTEDYIEGTFVDLFAIPHPGSYFNGWRQDCVGFSCLLRMNSNKTVNAVFELIVSETADLDIISLNYSVNQNNITNSSGVYYPVTLIASIRNIGNVDTIASTTQLLLDGHARFISTLPFAIGQTRNVEYTYYLTEGNYTAEAYADWRNEIVELNEFNNGAFLENVFVPDINVLPDLDITFFNYIVNSTGNITNSSGVYYPVTLLASVKNLGRTSAIESTTLLSFFETSNRGFAGYIFTPSILPGQTINLHYTDYAIPGFYNATANADWNNMVREPNELNNVQSFQINVP